MTLISKRKILLAVLSGVMLTASFPPINMDWIAWFALVPLLKSLEKEPPSSAFKLGSIAGLFHYFTLIYWIIIVISSYGGLNHIISSAVLLLLCLYLSLYPALFSLLISYIRGSRFRAFLTAGVWVSLEYARARLLTGFPWCLFGYCQFKHTNLIQVTDTVGVYGISFLIVFANTLICMLFFNNRAGTRKRYMIMETFLLIILGATALLYGNYRIGEKSKTTDGEKPIKVAVVQGNIDQSLKWESAYQKATLDRYRNLTQNSLGFRPHLILWPETALPFFFQDNSELKQELHAISDRSEALMIFGSPAYNWEKGETVYYNRIYYRSPGEIFSGYYDKVHLVPFGEYVPLKKFLPFVQRLVHSAGDFTSGSEVTPMDLPDLPTGGLICYEAIFPELSRTHVKKGAKLLVNLTNDAWFGMTSAPYQHLSMSLFRAVENRRPLVRAANTGFSAFIDSKGRMMAVGNLFEEGVLINEVKIGNDSLTFYSRYGDIFVYLILLLCLIKFFRELCYHLKKDKYNI
jgi:apolipoprotein N-acyltransferase